MRTSVKKIYLEILPSFLVAPFRRQSLKRRVSSTIDALIVVIILLLATIFIIPFGCLTSADNGKN